MLLVVRVAHSSGCGGNELSIDGGIDTHPGLVTINYTFLRKMCHNTHI